MGYIYVSKFYLLGAWCLFLGLYLFVCINGSFRCQDAICCTEDLLVKGEILIIKKIDIETKDSSKKDIVWQGFYD